MSAAVKPDASPPPDRFRRRLDRQFDAISRAIPASRNIVAPLRSRRATLVRIPVAFFFIAGGIFSFLPVLGLWMLPLGLLLLAVDLPLLRPFVTTLVIRLRDFARRWRRKLR